MRRLVYVILVLVFLVAACQPTESPTLTPDAGGATTIIVDATTGPTAEPLQREIVTGEPMPLPGTILSAATEDVGAGTPFARIYFERTGGIAGGTLVIEILGDGTFTRDGVAGQLQPAQVQQLNDLLTQINFFAIQGIFTAPGTGADIYKYAITVDRSNGDSRMIQAQDGLIPAPLQTMVTLLQDIGKP